MRKRKLEGFKQVEIPTRMLDSIWISDDEKFLRIKFATGVMLDFKQIVDKKTISTRT